MNLYLFNATHKNPKNPEREWYVVAPNQEDATTDLQNEGCHDISLIKTSVLHPGWSNFGRYKK